MVNRWAVLMMGLLAWSPAMDARAQLSLDGILESAAEMAAELNLDPALLRAPTREEWNEFWRITHTVLQSESLADLAELHPYAEMALSYLEGFEDAKPYADWLRQRVDYLWMADEVMKQEPARPAPPPAPKPEVARPAPQPRPGTVTVVPPKRPPAPKPPVSANKKSMDIERWTRRIQSRPPPAMAATYVPRLKPVFNRHGVPEQLVWLAEVESSFDPLARSPVGAMGLYQFMPATAERFGLQLKPTDERTMPERSAGAAAQYLKFLHGRFGSWPLALAAYNAGEGRVGRLLKTHNATTFEGIADHLPAETRMYVPKIAAVLKVREGADLSRL